MTWNDIQTEILKDNYCKISTPTLSKMLNKSVNSIQHKAFRLKLKKGSKFSHNNNFFEEITLQNSYWAGFIAADGCIQNNSSSLVVRLQTKDEQHLALLKDVLKFTGTIKKYPSKSHKTGEFLDLSIHSAQKICESLHVNFNITPRKSLTLEPPLNITDDNHKIAYIIGYIDGDGSIGRYGKKKELRISIVGTKLFLDWIRGIINCGSKIHAVKNKNYFQYALTGKNADNFIKKVKLLNLPYLKRKWEIER